MKALKFLLLMVLSCVIAQSFADNRKHFKNIINTHGMQQGTGVVTAIAPGQATIVIAPGETLHRDNFPLYYTSGYVVVNARTGATESLPVSCTTTVVPQGVTLIFQGDIYPDKKATLSCATSRT